MQILPREDNDDSPMPVWDQLKTVREDRPKRSSRPTARRSGLDILQPPPIVRKSAARPSASPTYLRQTQPVKKRASSARKRSKANLTAQQSTPLLSAPNTNLAYTASHPLLPTTSTQTFTVSSSSKHPEPSPSNPDHGQAREAHPTPTSAAEDNESSNNGIIPKRIELQQAFATLQDSIGLARANQMTESIGCFNMLRDEASIDRAVAVLKSLAVLHSSGPEGAAT